MWYVLYLTHSRGWGHAELYFSITISERIADTPHVSTLYDNRILLHKAWLPRLPNPHPYTLYMLSQIVIIVISGAVERYLISYSFGGFMYM